ncbi:thermonuclease family protein [Bradyrhizobium sp. USDA 3256]
MACVPVDHDQYGRTVATCSVNRVDLAQWFVTSGLAFDWPQYSKDRYSRAQREAEHGGAWRLGRELRCTLALSRVPQGRRKSGM